MIDGKDGVIDALLEQKDFPDPKTRKACNGALWNMRNKLKESKKYQEIGNSKFLFLHHNIRLIFF